MSRQSKRRTIAEIGGFTVIMSMASVENATAALCTYPRGPKNPPSENRFMDARVAMGPLGPNMSFRPPGSKDFTKAPSLPKFRWMGPPRPSRQFSPKGFRGVEHIWGLGIVSDRSVDSVIVIAIQFFVPHTKQLNSTRGVGPMSISKGGWGDGDRGGTAAGGKHCRSRCHSHSHSHIWPCRTADMKIV